MVDDTAAIGITAYARHRGCSAAAVHKAIRTGRLRGAVVKVQGRTMLRSAAAADREWENRTDRSRRPEYARMALDAPQVLPADPLPSPPPSDDASDETSPIATNDPVLADYQRETMRERARKLKLENDEREGALVEVAKVNALAFEFARVLRESVMNVPGRIGAQLAAESDPGRVHLLLERALREALETTASAMDGGSAVVETSPQP